uniref:Uncharacterized protein n=1 Tax=Amphimedon queenslandica TaxID=400682 RepID=A0A1X7SDQ3_AMPQE
SDTFYGALVKHIKNLLEEREKNFVYKEWVLNEALSTEKLQSGGTFQNVLTRRLDEVIIPLFADILLFVDHYSNLNLLKEARDYVEQLWLSIFSNEELVLFSYQSYAMGKGIHELQPTTTGVIGGRVLAADEEFVCCFPFFWLIKEAIEAKLDAVRTSS